MSPGAARRVLVLGLGNDLLGDDAAGLRIAREVRERLCAGHAGPRATEIVVRQSAEMGLALLDEIVGFDAVIVVDAIDTGNANPGALHEFAAEALVGRHVSAPHFVGIPETLELGRRLGLAMPDRVQVVAVEVRGPLEVSTELTAPVRDAIPTAAQRVLAIIDEDAAEHEAALRRQRAASSPPAPGAPCNDNGSTASFPP